MSDIFIERLMVMDVRLEIVYKGPKTPKLLMESDRIDSASALSVIHDMLKTGRIKEIKVIDDMDREWSHKEFEKLFQKMEEELSDPVIYFDGGYERVGSRAGIGIVLYYRKGKEEYRVKYNHLIDGIGTNNEAEYAALYQAVVLLEQMEFLHMPVVIRGDSQGVLKQLEGEWPCYEKELNSWLDKIEAKLEKLDLRYVCEVIPRSQNKEADKLASQALKNQIIDSHAKMNS